MIRNEMRLAACGNACTMIPLSRNETQRFARSSQIHSDVLAWQRLRTRETAPRGPGAAGKGLAGGLPGSLECLPRAACRPPWRSAA
jgi:hypothetical protein